MSEIVKVQIPLASNDPAALPLIYDRYREHETLQKLDHTTKKLMGTDVKAFFKAEWRHASQQWTLGNRVSDRDW
jgi:hypothetical protein